MALATVDGTIGAYPQQQGGYYPPRQPEWYETMFGTALAAFAPRPPMQYQQKKSMLPTLALVGAGGLVLFFLLKGVSNGSRTN